jgi:hypothetical protein
MKLRVRRARAQLGHEIPDAVRAGIQTRQLMQGDVLERAAYGRIHALPRAADPALALDAARLAAPLHSVMAMGPSNTSRICVAVICSGRRAKR